MSGPSGAGAGAGDRIHPVRIHVLVEGRVQGVGFRQACADQARRRRLAGWVRNRRDGRVEAVFEGPADAVAAMVEWCRTGPPAARVTAVDAFPEPADSPDAPEPAESLTGFRISATV